MLALGGSALLLPILLMHLALLFQVAGTIQSGKLLSRNGKEEGHGLMEH